MTVEFKVCHFEERQRREILCEKKRFLASLEMTVSSNPIIARVPNGLDPGFICDCLLMGNFLNPRAARAELDSFVSLGMTQNVIPLSAGIPKTELNKSQVYGLLPK